MKKKVKLSRIVLICMVVILFLPVIKKGLDKIFVYDRESGKLSVYKSFFYDYEYEIDKDGNVCLEDYHGGEVEVVIPDEVWGHPVTGIGMACFRGNTIIESVIIPSSVRTIDSDAFENCTNLKEVTSVGEVKIVSIGHNAFNNCSNLEKFNCGNAIKFIGVSAFSNCTKLKTINDQPELENIRDYAFANSGLMEISIENLENLDHDAFENTPYLESLRSTNKEFLIENSILFDCNSTNKVIVIPDNVNIIDCDFSDCPNVEMIVINNVEAYNDGILPKGKKIQLVFLNAIQVSCYDEESNVSLIWLKDKKTSQIENYTTNNGIEIEYLLSFQMSELLKEYGVSWKY